MAETIVRRGWRSPRPPDEYDSAAAGMADELFELNPGCQVSGKNTPDGSDWACLSRTGYRNGLLPSLRARMTRASTQYFRLVDSPMPSNPLTSAWVNS